MKKCIYSLLVYMLCITTASAQTWTKINNPAGAKSWGIFHVAVENDTIAILADGGQEIYDTNKVKRKFIVYERTANSWDSICSFIVVQKQGEAITGAMGRYDDDMKSDFIRLKGNYYFIGTVDSVIGLGPGIAGALAWENNTFSKVRAPVSAALNCYSVQGELPNYANGGDTLYLPMIITVGNQYARSVIVKHIPGSTDTVPYPSNSIYWRYITNTQLGPLLWHAGDSGFFRGKLIRYGQPEPTFPLYILDSTGTDTTTHVQPQTMIYSPDLQRAISRGTLGYTTILERNGWKVMHSNAPPAQLGSVFIYEDLIIGCVHNDTTLYNFRNNRWQNFSIGTKSYSDCFRAGQYLYGLSSPVATSSGVSLYRLNKTTGRLQGHVFIDSDNDCYLDAGEAAYDNAVIKIMPGNHIVNTDETGQFTAILDSGTYTLTLISKKHHAVSCAPGSVKVIMGQVTDTNISVSPMINKKDLAVSISSLTGSNARRGARVYYSVTIENVGTIKAQASLRVKLHPKCTDSLNTGLFTKLDSVTLSYQDSLDVNEKKKLNFSLFTNPAKLAAGDDISFTAAFDSAYSDLDSSDNADLLKQRIVAAFDPNEKNCFPGSSGGTQIKEIRYNIHFQNLGTDSAVRITVVDTFDVRMPLDKVTITDCSHPYSVKLKNNVITWTFDNIMLPPSRQNYEKSMGCINMVAKLNAPLSIGDSIRNKAYIYFDYEDAVITNLAVLKNHPIGFPEFGAEKSKSLQIYPNPASNTVSVVVPGNGAHEIVLSDILGRSIGTYHFEGAASVSVDLSALPNGIYIMKDEEGNSARLVINR